MRTQEQKVWIEKGRKQALEEIEKMIDERLDYFDAFAEKYLVKDNDLQGAKRCEKVILVLNGIKEQIKQEMK